VAVKVAVLRDRSLVLQEDLEVAVVRPITHPALVAVIHQGKEMLAVLLLEMLAQVVVAVKVQLELRLTLVARAVSEVQVL
jgi:hypothetical protein